ncbi:MAG: hypothetical protein IT381_02550 [Deltaproteobacteria bacterium]|nr:hypothetical protein [Deltaproteobacteria bacterium]
MKESLAMDNPLMHDEIFLRTYVGEKETPAKDKPEHYKVISISLYKEDIELLERLVQEAKKLGHTKANKSQIIRCALHTLDLQKLPKTY